MNLFPLSRCASATKIVCPLESTSDTQPQLQPALLRLSAMISQNFIGTQMRMSESVNSRQSKNLSRESFIAFFVTTEPEVRNIKPRKYSSTSRFSTRFAKTRHGS